MNTAKIIPFRFESREVRTAVIGNEPWFAAQDILNSLDYNSTYKPSRAMSHVPDQWKGVQPMHTPGGNQNLMMLSEQGLYFFLGRSDKPKALPFQMWLAGEVLPAIRKHGRYEDTENKMAKLVNETIGQNGFKILQTMIKGKVSKLPTQLQHGAKVRIWNRVHSTFRVLAAKDIPSTQLDQAIKYVAAYEIEGEYIPKSAPVSTLPQLTLKYRDIYNGKKWLDYSDMYNQTWLVHLVNLVCQLEPYEGKTVPVNIEGIGVLKKEVMSLMALVDDQARKLQEIGRISATCKIGQLT